MSWEAIAVVGGLAWILVLALGWALVSAAGAADAETERWIEAQ